MMTRPTTSASNIHRRKLCPGSEAMEAGLPDDDSPQSLEGRMLHEYDANPSLDRAFLKPNQQDLLRISQELDEQVFERVMGHFGIRPDESFTEGRETELVALLHDPDGETPGHCDRWRLYTAPRVLVIIDKKFGYKIVTPAAANLQLRTYAIGGSEEWECENVAVAITQPRLSFSERVTMACYDSADILASASELTEIRIGCRATDAPLHSGELQCQYCKAKTKCPAFASQLVPLDAGKEIVNALGTLKPEQRDGLIRAVKFAAFIKDALMDNEREVITAGGESLYTLGKAKEVRHVTDVKRAVALLALRGDITRDEAMNCCEMSIGAIEEKVRLNRKSTWKETREIVDGALASVLERKTQRAPLSRDGKLLK